MAFLEQLGKRITDAGQNVAQQTKNFTDITQLNSTISDKEKKISQLMLLIGQIYYEKNKNNTEADFYDKISEINVLYQEIFQNKEKIKQIKGIVKCVNCGVDVPINADFCNACGTKIIHVTNEMTSVTDKRICPKCNTLIENNNSFCTHCGEKLN